MQRLLPFLPVLTFALAGCPEPTIDCTAEARSSISLTLVDPDGAAIDDATVSYTVDGGDSEACEAFTNGSYACAYEVAGAFDVTIDAAGFEPDSFTVDVLEDECHVITQVVERTLTPEACPPVVLPSVEVTVTDSQGASIESADVAWNMAAEDDLPEPCTHVSGNVWTCAEEVAGEMAIEISNAGPYEAFRETVTVQADSCNVVTASLDAVLQYLPD